MSEARVDPSRDSLFNQIVEKTAEWPAPPAIQEVADRLGVNSKRWWHQCHGASLQIVRARIIPGARVARGTANGVGGQHSWVVVGNPYAPDRIFDPTLWSYQEGFDLFEVPRSHFRGYRPHGSGSVWDASKPPTARDVGEEPVTLEGYANLSAGAQLFIEMCGPLGRTGWSHLANGPMQGWPAAEVIAAMDDTKGLTALVPIDILGMLTDRNPDGLYLPEES